VSEVVTPGVNSSRVDILEDFKCKKCKDFYRQEYIISKRKQAVLFSLKNEEYIHVQTKRYISITVIYHAMSQTVALVELFIISIVIFLYEL
jgi:predicted nucleic-acid-binding Zn-ribbon protein